VTDGAILTVNPDRIITEVTAQACHERGLAQVVRDLLDFEGDELYLHEFPELVGSTYAEAQQSFDKAALLGIGRGDGIVLNPSRDRVVEARERILALVEDDSTFISSGVRPVPQVAVGDEPDPEPPLRILVVGWSVLAPQVIRELDEFLSPGSRLTVVVDPTLARPEDASADLRLANSTVEVQTLSGGPEQLSALLATRGTSRGSCSATGRGSRPATPTRAPSSP